MFTGWGEGYCKWLVHMRQIPVKTSSQNIRVKPLSTSKELFIFFVLTDLLHLFVVWGTLHAQTKVKWQILHLWQVIVWYNLKWSISELLIFLNVWKNFFFSVFSLGGAIILKYFHIFYTCGYWVLCLVNVVWVCDCHSNSSRLLISAYLFKQFQLPHHFKVIRTLKMFAVRIFFPLFTYFCQHAVSYI